MIRLLFFFIFTLFSVQVLASSAQYFPGPAQAPLSVNSSMVMNGEANFIHHDVKPVKIGFDKYTVYPADKNRCSDNTLDWFECDYDPLSRAKNKGLKPLKNVSEGGVLSPETIAGTDLKITSESPNYSSIDVAYTGQIEFEEGIYYIGTLSLGSQTRLKTSGDVELHVNELLINGKTQINNLRMRNELIIWVHEAKHESAFNSDSAIFAFIYSNGDVGLELDVQVVGAITAKNLRLSRGSVIEYYGPPESYNLVLNPINASASACESIPIEFSIKDDNGVVQTDVSGVLKINATSVGDTACWSEAPSLECSTDLELFNLESGLKRLWLQNKAIGTVNVEATFNASDTGELTSEQGNYTFNAGGFRFSPSPLKMVAGKPEKLSIEAVYGDCDPTPIPDYEGTKTLKFGEASYLQPAYLSGGAPKKPTINGNSDEQTLNINFVDGRAKNAVTVRYADAGALSIPVEEVSTGKSQATLPSGPESKAMSEKLQGDAVLHVRPYTLAICHLSGKQNPATDNGRLSKAGDAFSASLKPVIWKSGDRNDGGIVTLDEAYCSRPITPSFKAVDAPAAQVQFDDVARIVTPVSGNDATLNGFTPKTNTDATSNGLYPFSTLNISDVGTFKIRSQLVSKYLDMTVNPGQRDVGRFYPSHFGLSARINPGIEPAYDDESKGFTYLEQPFSGNYVIHAMTTDNKPVKNYHVFSGANDKAAFEDWAVHDASDMTSRWEHPALPSQAAQQWKAGAGGASEVAIDGSMMVQKSASPDGPFESLRFAVGVKSPDRDGTGFTFCDENAAAQCVEKVPDPKGGSDGAKFGRGDFLFGRMRIEGFTETQDLTREQTLPVTVEVFNGSHFVTNARDNATNISTEAGVAQKNVLFSDTTVEADRAQIVLKNSANEVVQTKRVEKGTSVFHVIPPNQDKGPNREQFRFWQKLGAPTKSGLRQTWLQYRWQGDSFNEDPSAIGTFGFYRGSDRVIFKGEKNITLTGE
ncbi:DUF6701 domain-containing protein [Enterovibrio norvegicus]|uniref:DUF6701 domain-containing protein n=1 Tax=Enterovibrio norvegicus TaxID=188144 RepID=UPI00352FDEDE